MIWAYDLDLLMPPAVPSVGTQLAEQPVERITTTSTGYYRSVLLKKAFTCIPQHVHDHAHDTLVCNGRARGWADGEYLGEKEAGEAFEIAAGKRHVFQALEDNTRLACIHNIESADSVKRKGL